jgi:hypothetical protein
MVVNGVADVPKEVLFLLLIERGNRVVRIDTLIKLAAALAVSPLLLLDGIIWTVGGPNRASPSPASTLPAQPEGTRSR